MGNVIVGGRQSIGDDVEDEISDFEHCFAASCEDATDGLLPPPLPGYTPSIGPPPTTRRGSKDTINEPLKGRLVTVHMLEREFLLKEAVGVVEQTVLRISYSSIQVLTWDHATSSLKVDHVATAVADDEHLAEEERGLDDRTDSSQPDLVFISVRVENSIDLEDELKQRARAEAVSARRAGRTPKAAPTSVYLGMFAGFTKPKPFQRKRPNLSFTVPEGKLPTLQVGKSISRCLFADEHIYPGSERCVELREFEVLLQVAVFVDRSSVCTASASVMVVTVPSCTVAQQNKINSCMYHKNKKTIEGDLSVDRMCRVCKLKK